MYIYIAMNIYCNMQKHKYARVKHILLIINTLSVRALLVTLILLFQMRWYFITLFRNYIIKAFMFKSFGYTYVYVYIIYTYISERAASYHSHVLQPKDLTGGMRGVCKLNKCWWGKNYTFISLRFLFDAKFSSD